MLYLQCFPARLRITHPIKEMFVYIYNIHVYCMYMYIILYTVCPCLQDLARMKVALYMLAHVPKRLLDPAINQFPDYRLAALNVKKCA